MPHLKAGNSEAAGVVHRSHDRDQEGAVGDVLLVKLHRDLIITWRRGGQRERHGFQLHFWYQEAFVDS